MFGEFCSRKVNNLIFDVDQILIFLHKQASKSLLKDLI